MKNVIFLGDSITEWFEEISELENVINLGVRGNKTNEMIGRLDSVVNKDIEQLFLLVGINDFFTNKGKWGGYLRTPFLQSYDCLLKVLKASMPNTKFYIQSILPISSSTLANKNEVVKFNKELTLINKELEKLVCKYKMNYLNFSNYFKDSDGVLKEDYTLDGTHLSKKGYQLYYKLIKPFIRS